ncbi:unnamed protein product [Caenorhabditis brenneri]
MGLGSLGTIALWVSLLFGLYKTPVENGVIFHIQVLDECKDTLKLVLHNHVLELFKNSPEVLYESFPKNALTTINLFPNVTQLCLAGEKTVDADYTEQFFSKCENLEGALVEPSVEPLLNEHSKLTTVKKLYFENAHYQVKALALHFKGHHAVFENAKCNNRTIEQFLKRWIAHEAFQELKSMKIAQCEEWLFYPDWIYNDIELDWKNRPERPEVYVNKERLVDKYNDKDKIMYFDSQCYNCADFVDIQRQFDGKWASFKITTECFKFCVWD